MGRVLVQALSRNLVDISLPRTIFFIISGSALVMACFHHSSWVFSGVALSFRAFSRAVVIALLTMVFIAPWLGVSPCHRTTSSSPTVGISCGSRGMSMVCAIVARSSALAFPMWWRWAGSQGWVAEPPQAHVLLQVGLSWVLVGLSGCECTHSTEVREPACSRAFRMASILFQMARPPCFALTRGFPL